MERHRRQDWARPDLHIDLARAVERACFDFLLLEDSVFVPDNYGGSMDFYLKRAMRAPKNDPLPLMPLMAQATRRLGVVPTISTSFYPPYLLARLIATLDLMSKGRVAAISSPRRPSARRRTSGSRRISSTTCATRWPTSSSRS